MGEKVCIKVPVVVGLGSTQHLICTEIPLHPAALEIKDIQKKVCIESCEVGGNDKVIINAVLRKISRSGARRAPPAARSSQFGTVTASSLATFVYKGYGDIDIGTT